ncbi:hypothetical protein ACQPZX_02685 [Actinoplanes sp. CA-142083]
MNVLALWAICLAAGGLSLIVAVMAVVAQRAVESHSIATADQISRKGTRP